MTLIDQIRDLIAEGETQRSLDELYKYVKESNADVIDNLVMLRSRMQNLQRSVSNGTMDDQDAALERAKINEAILKLLPQLTPEYLAEASKRREPVRHAANAAPYEAPAAPPRDMKKMYLIGGGALVVVILLIVMLSGGGDSEENPSVETTSLAPANDEQQGGNAVDAQESAQQTEDNTAQTQSQTEEGSFGWRSNDGRIAFSTEDGTNWVEEQNGVVRFKYTTADENTEYVEIYDASRNLTLRIFESNVKFQQSGESEWSVLAYGRWK
jgi:hypothetical protein